VLDGLIGNARRFETMPSQPSAQACLKMAVPSPAKCSLKGTPSGTPRRRYAFFVTSYANWHMPGRLVYRCLRNGVKDTARRNRQIIEPVVAAFSTVTPRLERRIREKLSLAPDFAEIKYSPSGSLLTTPIRMSTCDGRDQISRAIYYRGWWAFEHALPRLLEQALNAAPAGLFLDVGANTGVYSLLSKGICRLREVHAFEPLPLVQRILRENIDLNKFGANIIVVDAAASDETGTADLFVPTQEHGLVETSASLSSNFKSAHSDILTVRTIKLDDYCRQIGPKRVAVMKIDVEGMEHKVLKGAQNTIARDRPIIFCEVLPSASTWAEISLSLESAG
jgi:FkbM family methyltransferase